MPLTALDISAVDSGEYKDVDFLLSFVEDGKPVCIAIRTPSSQQKTKWLDELHAQQKLSVSAQPLSQAWIDEVLGYGAELRLQLTLSPVEQRLLRATTLVEALLSRPMGQASSSAKAVDLVETNSNFGTTRRRQSAPHSASSKQFLLEHRKSTDSFMMKQMSRQTSLKSQESFPSARTLSSSESVESVSQASISEAASSSVKQSTSESAPAPVKSSFPIAAATQRRQSASSLAPVGSYSLNSPHKASQLSLASTASDDGDDMRAFLDHFLPQTHSASPRQATKAASQPAIVVVPPKDTNLSPASNGSPAFARSRSNSFRGLLIRAAAADSPPQRTESPALVGRARTGSFLKSEFGRMSSLPVSQDSEASHSTV